MSTFGYPVAELQAELEAAPTAPVLKPKYARFSEAMEAGWAQLKQETNGHFASYKGNKLVGACAIGAACYAAGVPADRFADFDQYFPRLNRKLPKLRQKELQRKNMWYREAEAEPRWDPETVETIADAVIVMNDLIKMPKEELVATVRSWGY
jgi:hypothetical protein